LGDSRWVEFEAYVRELMQKTHIVGAAVAVSREGEVLYQNGFGVRNLATGDPVTPDTIFGIGSVSKSFTGLAIMKLQDQGKLNTDDPVIHHLPGLLIRNIPDMGAVKVKHILSHTTGLSPVKRREEVSTFSEHMDYLGSIDCRILGRPGDYFSYCNDTFLLNGAIIERITGQKYRSYMTEHLVKDTGLLRTTYDITELAGFDNVTVPYVYNKDTKQHEQRPYPSLGTYEVGGGVRSCVNALLRYGQIYVDGGMLDGKRVLTEAALRRMRHPVHQISRKAHYCFALETVPDYEGHTLVFHGGSQPGVSAYFGFVPEKRLVAAVLTNVTGVPAKAIWLGAMNAALSLPVRQQVEIEPQYSATVEELERLAGSYGNDEGGKFHVAVQAGIPVIEAEGERHVARASDERTLVYELNGFESPVRFFFDGKGEVWAARLGVRMHWKER